MAIVKYSQGKINEIVPSEKVDEIENPLLLPLPLPLIEKEASNEVDSTQKDQKEERPKWTK